MTKPTELVEAEMVYNLCRAYQALPEAGGVLDQSVGFIRMHKVLMLAGVIGEGQPDQAEDDPFAGIPMEALG